MIKTKINYLNAVCCFLTMFHYDNGFSQSISSTDSLSNIIFETIRQSVFSKGDKLFYIGIDRNSLAFDNETLKAIQNETSKTIDSLNVQMNDKRVIFNDSHDEARYYAEYNLSFKVNQFKYKVDNVRETGILKLKDGKWEIIQQHASVPVTNDVWPAYLAKQPVNSDPLYSFSVKELLEDYDLFTLALGEAHAGLFNYINPQRYNMLTDSIKKELTHPMSEMAFYGLICPIIEAIKCGHTRITLSNQTWKFLEKQDIFFPFQLKFISGKAYVLKNIKDKTIQPGSEILSINNKPISVIISEIYKMQNSDAGILTAKDKKLDEKFHELYCQFIEQPKSYTIQYIPYQTNKIMEITVNGTNNNEWWSRINTNNSPKKELLNLNVIENSGIAILDIRKFVSQEINEKYGSFQQFMDSAFKMIKEENLHNLIIDLRGNGGGDIAQELIPYLINSPIQYYKIIDAPKTRYSFLEHTDKGLFFNEINVNLWNKYRNENGRYELIGNYNEYIQPSPYVYNGNLFVLIDGNSFSGTSELSSILYDRKRATFFGEETGGSYFGSSSGDFINLTLPHTQIKVTIPIRNYIMNISSNSNTRRGVIPDYEITNTIKDILTGNDAEMNFVLNYISNNKK
jgi:C-terminal processing protease CtpA/Prc